MPLQNIVDENLNLIPTESLNPVREPATVPLAESYKLGFGFVDAISASMERDSIPVMAYDAVNAHIDDSGVEYDANFTDKAKSDLFDANYKDTIDPRMKDDFLSRARSQKHMEGLYDEYYTSSAKLRYLEEHSGLAQFGLGAMAEATNLPLYIGAVAMFPQTSALLGSTVLSRLAIGGIADGSLEGVKELIGKQDKNVYDYAGAVLLGGGMNAIFGKGTTAFNDIAGAMILRENGITKPVLDSLKKAGSQEEKNSIISSAFEAHTGKKADMTLVDVLDNNAKYANKNFLQKSWEAGRQDMAYITSKSKSDTMSGFSNNMFADPTGQNITPDKRDMSTSRDRLLETMRGERQDKFDYLKKEFSQEAFGSSGVLGIKVDVSVENSLSSMIQGIQNARHIHGMSINQAVIKTMDNGGLDSTNKKLVDILERAANEASALGDKYHDMLGEAGHTDFKINEDTGKSNIPKDPTYSRFAYDKTSFAGLLNKGFEKKDIIDTIKGAINSPAVRKVPLEGEVLDNVVGAFYSAISSSKLDTTGTFSEILQKIKTEATDIDTKKMIDEMLKSPAVSVEELGTSARARTNIDYAFSKKFIKDGKEIELKFEDFLSKDYFGNMDNYSRKMAGTTVLHSNKWVENLQPMTKTRAEKLASQSPEVIQAKQAIVDRDKAIVELHTAQKEFDATFKNSSDLDTIHDFFKASGQQLNDIKSIVDTAVRALGLKKEDYNLDYIKKNFEARAKLDELKAKANNIEVDTKMKSIMDEALVKAGFRGDLKEIAFNLSKLLKGRNLQATKSFIDDLKVKYPEHSSQIIDIAKASNQRFKDSGVKAKKTVSEKLFGKDVKPTKEQLASKEYKDAYAKYIDENKVNTSDFKKQLKDIEIAVSPKTRERTLSTAQDIQDMRMQIASELEASVNSNGMTESAMHNELVRFDTIIKDMTGVPTAKDPGSAWNRFYRIAHSYNVGRLLGQTFFTMPAEAMNVMWDSGLKNMLETLPMMKSLLKAYKNGKIDNLQVREIQQSLGIYDEFLSGARLYEFEQDFSAVRNANQGKLGKAVDKVEAFGEKFAEFTLMTGGIKPLTAWFQTAHVMGVFKKMTKVAQGGKKNTSYNKMIKELGLSQKMEENIYASIRDKSKDGLMNFDSWDTDVKNVFLDGVKRRTDTLVQMQRLGDKASWVTSKDYMMKDTTIGKFVFELKQFVMTAYTKQLGRAVNRADMHMLGLVTAQMMALSLAYITKQGYNYSGDKEKMRENLTAENIVLGTMKQMPQGSVLPMVMNFGSQLFTGEDLIGQSRHSNPVTAAMSALPVVDMAGKLIESASIPYKIASGEFKKQDLKAPASLTGVSNNAVTRPLYNMFMKD